MPKTMRKIFREEVSKIQADSAPSFCCCGKGLTTTGIIKMTCVCGEEHDQKSWQWDVAKERSDVVLQGNVLTFHPTYSRGTAVIKGEMPLEYGMQHYWEVKVLSFLTGTDFMIGIGTDKVTINSRLYQYVSFLGKDDQSWGYSYRGLVQHNHRVKSYGQKFSRGVIIGVHLDLDRGTIEFYVNRQPQGKAYLNIPLDRDIKLYPMISATFAKTTIKFINATSFKRNLQYFCMETISKVPELVERVKNIPGLVGLYNELWFLRNEQRHKCHTDFVFEDDSI